jgi:multiple sugar transport system substrate-binding protein
MSELYGEGGPLSLFVEQLETIAVPRPVTPAYPTITSAFTQALQNIANGSDIRKELNKAVEEIDRDIEYNDGYPMD